MYNAKCAVFQNSVDLYAPQAWICTSGALCWPIRVDS